MSATGPGLTLPEEDEVVLLDRMGKPCGTAPRRTVHGHATPRHLAFSCYVFDTAGRLLVTRRALDKATWPGVWTNSCCGHPRPSEEMTVAVIRRAREELRLELRDLQCALPTFSYRATAANGVVENELCPVFMARALVDPDPDPAEVLEWRWVDWVAYAQVAQVAPWVISPWSAEQMRQLVNVENVFLDRSGPLVGGREGTATSAADRLAGQLGRL